MYVYNILADRKGIKKVKNLIIWRVIDSSMMKFSQKFIDTQFYYLDHCHDTTAASHVCGKYNFSGKKTFCYEKRRITFFYALMWNSHFVLSSLSRLMKFLLFVAVALPRYFFDAMQYFMLLSSYHLCYSMSSLVRSHIEVVLVRFSLKA